MENDDVQEINRKRKNGSSNTEEDVIHQIMAGRVAKRFLYEYAEEDENMLALSLNSFRPSTTRQTTHPPQVDPPPPPVRPPQKPQPQQPQLPQSVFMQTLMAQNNPSLGALQLSPSHPVYKVPQQSSYPSTRPVSLVYRPAGGPENSLPMSSLSTPPLSLVYRPPGGPESSRPMSSPSTPSVSLVYRPPGGQQGISRPVPRGHHRPARRNPTQTPRDGKEKTVPAPFPWATTQRATVYSLHNLLSRKIVTITGDVQCKRCERQFEMKFDLESKFMEVASYIAQNKEAMRDRAPGVLMNPVLPPCKHCEQENSAKPVIAEKKKAINWLFLLLGKMLGCCTLEQLKYFCKHTKNHRTGAKDRVLYLTYLGLCKQLEPNGPFDPR